MSSLCGRTLNVLKDKGIENGGSRVQVLMGTNYYIITLKKKILENMNVVYIFNVV